MDILLGWPITNWLITNQQLHEACKWRARGSLDDDLLSCLHVWVGHFHVCWKNGAGHWKVEIPCSLFGGIPSNTSVILGRRHFRTHLRNLSHATLIHVPATCSAIFSPRSVCNREMFFSHGGVIGHDTFREGGVKILSKIERNRLE